MLEGYGFFWPPRQIPWLVSPSGRKIPLDVHDFVPYCSAAKKPQTVVRPGTKVANVLSAMVCLACEESEEKMVSPSVPLVPEHSQPNSVGAAAGSSNDPPADVVPEVPREEVEKPIPAVTTPKDPAQDERPEADEDLDLLSFPKMRQDTEREKLLRAEATSLRHLMTHLPKNPYCAHCQRAKITSKPARQRHPANDDCPPEQFWDRVLCDTMVLKNEPSKGFDGSQYGITFMDEATGYTDDFPVASRSTEEAAKALNEFEGPTPVIKSIYSDGAPEFNKMARKHRPAGVVHDISTPYRHTAATKIEPVSYTHLTLPTKA